MGLERKAERRQAGKAAQFLDGDPFLINQPENMNVNRMNDAPILDQLEGQWQKIAMAHGHVDGFEIMITDLESAQRIAAHHDAMVSRAPQ